ncbi:hypothetical protein L2E82_15728 [Cichorium intybus]|uniref:Uncharacterized protein n=1 Tax=Cichorium intybus TaxID=13427 RepID=A0ACB9F4S9_CICIN|nr:hypothetical protein L2E82_15728 [Cichorium intybus]
MAARNLEVLDIMGFMGGAVTQTLQKDGVVRMKILVKRQQLEQVLEQVVKKNDKNEGRHVRRPMSRSSESKSLEQRLKDMKRKPILRRKQVSRDCRTYWRPVLQSIPESRVLVI